MSTVDRSYRLNGGRTGILLIHGLGGTPVEMRYVAHGLARAGHTVSVPQLAGHCGTDGELKATKWPDWYGSVQKAHADLKARCDTIMVGGLSMGAILALHHAAQHPKDVDGLLLYAPTLKLDGWGVPWYAQLFDLVCENFTADFFRFGEREPWGIKDVRIRKIVADAILGGDSSQAGAEAVPGRSMLQLNRLVKAVRAELPAICQPTLIIHPREDDRASLKNNAFVLQRSLAGLVDTVVLDDSYHVITMDRQRSVVVERSVEFVERTRRANGEREAAEQLRKKGSAA